MPKFERILMLARMTRGVRSGTVKEMSRACGVSQRTIFRYLKTLATIDFDEELQVDHRNAPRGYPGREIDDDDRCLLCFALDHNPLVRFEYLANRLARIKTRLGVVQKSRRRALRGGFLEVDAFPDSGNKTSGDRILSAFAAAFHSADKLSVRVRGSQQAVLLDPLAIRIRNKGVALRFRAIPKGRPVTYDLSSITSTRIIKTAHGRQRGGVGRGRLTQ